LVLWGNEIALSHWFYHVVIRNCSTGSLYIFYVLLSCLKPLRVNIIKTADVRLSPFVTVLCRLVQMPSKWHRLRRVKFLDILFLSMTSITPPR